MTTRRWVAIGSLILVLAVMLVPTAKSWYDQRQRLAELQAQVSTQQDDVERLEREKELWKTDEYVESQARKRLKFVKVGEKSYSVIDVQSGEPEVDAETGAVRGESNQPWYDQLASSVEAADDPAAAR